MPPRRLSAIEAALTTDPPHGARVTVDGREHGRRMERAVVRPVAHRRRSTAPARQSFGKPARMMGEGGSIPFMGMLGERFPDAQFLVTGVLGPGSNAHGPNEFLHVPYATRLTAAVADILAAHGRTDGDDLGAPAPGGGRRATMNR